MNALTKPIGAFKDPAEIGYPPTLPVEIALREYDVKTICEAYGIDSEQWDSIRTNPIFISDLKARLVELQTDGVSFKMKARLQAVEYLKQMWTLAGSNETPAAVRADLMKFVVRAAGLDGSKDQAAAAGAVLGNALSITLHLGK
jgi:hypothetical protein